MSFSDIRAARQSKQQKSFVSVTSTKNEIAAADAQGSEHFQHELPSAIQVKVTPDKGRAIYAKNTIKAGCSVITLRPRVCVLSARYLNSFCSSCCAPTNQTSSKRCSKCKTLRYCNSDCQLSDWSVHKAECDCLQRIASLSSDHSSPPDAVRCLGRILFLRQKHGLPSNLAQEFDSMHSLKSSLPSSAHTSYAQLAHALVQYLGVKSSSELEPFGIREAGDLVDLISKFAINTHTLTTPTLTPIGLAVSPLLALANHSCDPNGILVFPRSSKSLKREPEMHLVCLQDINPGDEITVSYIDTTLPCSRRRELLKDTHGFNCNCSLCSASDRGDLDPRLSVSCPEHCGAFCPLPTNERPFIQCQKCQANTSMDVESVLDLIRIGQEGLEKATALQETDPSYALKLTTNLIPLLTSTGLSNASHPLLALRRLQHLLLSTSLSGLSTRPGSHAEYQKVLDDAIRIAAKVLSGLREVLPLGHPIRGIHLAETGKLLAADEFASVPESDSRDSFPPTGAARLNLAFRNSIEARKELLIGFGQENGGGQVGEEVRELIISLETEIGIWKDGVKTALEEQSTANRIVQR